MNTLGIPGLTALFSGNWNNGLNCSLTWCDGFRLSKKYIDPLMRKEVLKL